MMRASRTIRWLSSFPTTASQFPLRNATLGSIAHGRRCLHAGLEWSNKVRPIGPTLCRESIYFRRSSKRPVSVGLAILTGGSIVPLLKRVKQDGREYVFTQIDGKAGGDNVPMRCVQNAKYGYIYNPFSDGKHVYRNNNEGLTMAAMNQAAKTDATIAARVQLFRYRVPEEFYDLEEDPDCLHNLINSSEHREAITALQAKLQGWMNATNDPMLAAFTNRDDRTLVDQALFKAYGPQKKPESAKKGERKNKKNKS